MMIFFPQKIRIKNQSTQLKQFLLKKLNKKIYGSSQKRSEKYKKNIKTFVGEIEQVNGSVLRGNVFGATIQIEKTPGQRAEQMPERVALQPTGGIADYFYNVENPNDKGENKSSPRGFDEKIVDEKFPSFA